MIRFLTILSFLLLIGCSSQDSVSENAGSELNPDFEGLFGIYTELIPISEKDNALVIEHWFPHGWHVMSTIPIHERVENKTPFYWSNSYSEDQFIYAIPQLKGGYILPENSGKLIYKGLEKGNDGAWNLMYRESNDKLFACVRITPIYRENKQE